MKNEKIKKIFKMFENSPMSFTLESSNLEIRGNKEVKLEGCKKILFLSQDCIKVSVKGMYVSFYGKNLKIKCLTYDSLLIQGFINKVEFNI